MSGPDERHPPTLGRSHLVDDLRALGVRPGVCLLVHCGLRRVGPLEHGPATLAGALRDVLGPAGTLLVPTQTDGNSTTSRAHLAAVAEMDRAQRDRYEAALPGWDRQTTPSQRMGVLAEYVRCAPGAVRSDHPQTSFAALGPRARQLTDGHDLTCHLGQRSPVGGLYAADGQILLLGLGYEACSALHLAEYRLPVPTPERDYHCFRLVDGRRVRLDFRGLDLDDRDFPQVGAALDGTPFVQRGRVGRAQARLLPARAAVDFAVGWFAANRLAAQR
ncbi:AAC(3) family N-acetyltransferase [Micromonospora sp. LAH09]|uniref:aminoglycoside N(3)-acetyltransferase n=1 Tax=Micromonospora cabrerizensis TaxID=2911213 RepID=UPI001EE7AFDA|nr:AAC(3) family N-acetyltransferase [Micromonospora cabrerizensis]MCG5472303.1 AAC(3) family N-acetyltransferase [Micromonospora cabrerizensis]